MYTVYAEMYGWHVGINTCALYMYMYTNIIGAVYQFRNFIYSAHVVLMRASRINLCKSNSIYGCTKEGRLKLKLPGMLDVHVQILCT